MPTMLKICSELNLKLHLIIDRSRDWQREEKPVKYAVKTITKKIFMEFQNALIVSA